MALLPFNSDTFTTARGRARSALAGFTTGQKVMVGLAVVGLVVGGTEFMHFESKPNYQPLFTNLQASDSGAVTAQLTTAKIPYQLSNGGATVLVPAADVDQERVALAEQGVDIIALDLSGSVKRVIPDMKRLTFCYLNAYALPGEQVTLDAFVSLFHSLFKLA